MQQAVALATHLYFLPKTIGRTAANEALLTGKTFLGTEAYQLGLVN
jgi:enoyl-CoA hydratase/carnithine racemase